jgi:O-acetylserine/cysteine efflux transporter
MFSKKVAASSPLALVAWGNLIAFPFMLAFSFLMEGPSLIVSSIQNVSLETIAALVYIVYLSTFVGYGIWGLLLNSYATAEVVPFTLLVPVFGILSSVVLLGEDLPSWKIIACIFIMLGLIFNLLEKQMMNVIAKWRR